jgi:uncharacterized damage-inducible protein DinB
MTAPSRTASIFCTILLAIAAGFPVAVQAQTSGVRAEILRDITVAEGKYLGLARAVPEEQYNWSPAPGVRSFGQVLLHVAGNNYFLPTTVGIPAPSDAPIDDAYQSVVAFEQGATRHDVIAHLERSFQHVKEALQRTSDDDLDNTLDFFGQHTTMRGVWIQTVTHMSEHLGQSIAYARVNGVTPPWSN